MHPLPLEVVFSMVPTQLINLKIILSTLLNYTSLLKFVERAHLTRTWFLKVEMSLGNVTGVQIWTLSKGWLIGSGAKCYFMADLNCSAGASQNENHQMELPDDLSCRRKPVEHGNVLWGASAILICFSGLSGLWVSGIIPVQLGYPWFMINSGLGLLVH